jgi:hypothetical protein
MTQNRLEAEARNISTAIAVSTTGPWQGNTSSSRNPGRAAGFWYLLLAVIGPLRLVYIPGRLFVRENATATADNIAAHEWLFRFGMVGDLAAAVILIFLVLAFYRLFKRVDQYLAVLVVILVGPDAGRRRCRERGERRRRPHGRPGGRFPVRIRQASAGRAGHAVPPPARPSEHRRGDPLGAWLFPLGILVYRSRVLPRFLGVWLVINGFAYVILSLTGLLRPQSQEKVFLISQPALFGELALMLWLVVKGATTPALDDAASVAAVG